MRAYARQPVSFVRGKGARLTRDTVIRLLPPLVCDEMQIDDIVARVARLLSLNTDIGRPHV